MSTNRTSLRVCEPRSPTTKCRVASFDCPKRRSRCCRAERSTASVSWRCSVDAERLTVPALLRRHAGTTPDLQFVVTEDAALTYGELDRASRRLAARLVRAGVGKGTRVGLLMP